MLCRVCPDASCGSARHLIDAVTDMILVGDIREDPMRIKSSALGLAAATITAIAFGICGLFFVVAPGVTSAFMSWVLHIDITAMTRPVSIPNLLGGIVLFAAYVGTLAGATASLYNRFTSARAD